MKKCYLLLFTLLCLFSFNKIGYAYTVTAEVGKTSDEPLLGNCVYSSSDNNGREYFDLIPLEDGSGTNVYCRKDTNGQEITVSCSATANSIADPASFVKCVPPADEPSQKETNASPCTQKKPCFRGTCSSVADSSVLSYVGAANINGTVYTQYACQKNAPTTVTCNYNGITETTTYSCTGMEEEIEYDIILDGNCSSRGSSIRFKGHPEADKTGFECTSPKASAIETIECTLPDGHIKFYGNYNCSDGTYQDVEGNNLTGGTINNNEPTSENQPNSEVLKNLCNVEKNPGAMRAFKMGGLALNILKIMIPILLIIFGCIDFAQAVISSDEKQLSKSIVKLAQRVIAGVVIFIIPTLIKYIFNMVDSDATSKYKACYECLLDVSSCPEIPKVGEK